MASFGKKFLSAFVEVTDEPKPVTVQEEPPLPSTKFTPLQTPDSTAEKFRHYFDKLFSEANLPGPDYYEFAKMTQAMTGIADEQARYSAAFAGLSVQGLDKSKLLHTATEYLKLLDADAANFNSTVDAALQEKVKGKLRDIENKQQRINNLAKEINDLQQHIVQLQTEVKENEEKIESNTGAYRSASQMLKEQIQADMERIGRHIR